MYLWAGYLVPCVIYRCHVYTCSLVSSHSQQAPRRTPIQIYNGLVMAAYCSSWLPRATHLLPLPHVQRASYTNRGHCQTIWRKHPRKITKRLSACIPYRCF